jgi:hypothetical protein
VEVRVLQYLLDALVECQPVGKAGERVAQHLGPEALLRFDLGGLVDHRHEAALGGVRPCLQTREPNGEMPAADHLAVMAVKFVSRFLAVEEVGERPPDRTGLQDRNLIDPASDRISNHSGHPAETVVCGIHAGRLAIGSRDDRGRNRERVEIILARIIDGFFNGGHVARRRRGFFRSGGSDGRFLPPARGCGLHKEQVIGKSG